MGAESEVKVKAVEYLRKREWSMGNGQCPDCCGVPESWHGHPCHLTAATIGHSQDCPLADALRHAGEKPLMKGEFISDVVYENFWDENGFADTRIRKAQPCQKRSGRHGSNTK